MEQEEGAAKAIKILSEVVYSHWNILQLRRSLRILECSCQFWLEAIFTKIVVGRRVGEASNKMSEAFWNKNLWRRKVKMDWQKIVDYDEKWVGGIHGRALIIIVAEQGPN